MPPCPNCNRPLVPLSDGHWACMDLSCGKLLPWKRIGCTISQRQAVQLAKPGAIPDLVAKGLKRLRG